MKQEIAEMMNDDILRGMAASFGIPPESLRLEDGFESFVYHGEQAGESCILRITHNSYRNRAEILAETAWIHYLARNGIPAATPIPSPRGETVITYPARQGEFIGTLFTKAKGSHLPSTSWTPSFHEQFGEIVGRMHQLTKDYTPEGAYNQRPHFIGDVRKMESQFMVNSPQFLLASYRSAVELLETLPKDRDSYGLIHYDLHRGNFFFEDGRITLFDFADCLYHYFIADLAMVLFYAIPHDCTSGDSLRNAELFFTHLLKGYFRNNHLPTGQFSKIPAALKVREIELYAVISESMNEDDYDPWCASYMHDRLKKIREGRPYIDLDFEAIAQSAMEE